MRSEDGEDKTSAGPVSSSRAFVAGLVAWVRPYNSALLNFDLGRPVAYLLFVVDGMKS